MKFLGVIPARKGSGRLKDKLFFPLSGKKLIEYSFKAAKTSKLLDKVILSTNDERLVNLAKNADIEVIMRPEELCRSEVPSALSIIHALKILEQRREKYDAVVLLQPTSPLRTAQDIDDAIELFKGSKQAISLFSVCEYSNPPHWALDMKDNFITPHFDAKFFVNSEKLPKVYRPNGAIGISRVNDFKKNQKFFTEKTLGYIMSEERSVDIDTEFDIKFAERLMEELK